MEAIPKENRHFTPWALLVKPSGLPPQDPYTQGFQECKFEFARNRSSSTSPPNSHEFVDPLEFEFKPKIFEIL